MPEITMQCAWCRRRYDDNGVEANPLPTLLPGASHGLCLNCLYGLVRRQCERLAARGDVAGLRRAERTRWQLLVLLVRRQFERREPPTEHGIRGAEVSRRVRSDGSSDVA